MPENNNVAAATAAEKRYIVKIGSAPKSQVWSAEKYERNKDALFDKYEDAEVYESTPYNGETVNAGDAFSVYIPGTEQGQIWDADKYERNREALASKYPGAEVKRVSPVDYWGEQRAQLDSLDSQIAELEGTTKEAQNQWNLLRYNDFEKGSDEEVVAGAKAKNLEKELDELCRKRENNPVYKRTNKAVGVYLEAMRDDTKAKTAALDEKYAPEIETSKNLFSGSREAAIAKLQMPTEYTTDSAALQAARMYYDDAIKVWNAPSRYGKESGFANFFKGLIGEAPEALSVVQLAKAIGEGAPLIEVMNKIHEHEGESVNIINLIQNEPDKLDYLSPAQKSLLNAFITKSSVDAARSNDLSLGYQAGQTAMKSLGFMADFLLTGGIGDAAAKGATKGIIKGAVKGLAKIENGTLRAITKEASKFGIGTFQSGVKTLAISGMMPSTYANVINNLTNLNDAGDVDLSGRAVTNAIGDALIENLSESAGTQVEAILGMPFRAIGATGAGKLFANTEFGAWAKALKNAPAGRIMKQAAWNGLIGEIGEEWYGNALRVLTGVDPDALKNFATAEQQIITWASFAPMSILGGGASIAQYEVSKKQLDNAGKYLRQALANAGYDVATIDNVLAAANAENPTELAKGLAPVIVQTANDNVLQSNSVFKAVLDYAGAVSKYRTYGGFIDADMSEKRQAMSDEISAGMGVQAAQEGEAEPSRPWVITRMRQIPDGSYVTMNSVRVVTDKDGVEYFVQSESEDGSLAAIDRQGNPHIISSADLVSGTMQDTGEMPLNDYLDRELTKRRLSEDEERVQSEFDRNRQNLLSQAAPGTPINLGTVEAPKRGTIIAYQAGKFIVQDENGVVTEVSEEQMSHILDVPYNVETEAEAIDREVSDIERKEELRTKANAVKGVDVSSVLGLEGHGTLHSVSLDNDGNLIANIRVDEDNVITKPVSEDELASIIALGEQNSPADVKDETEAEVASENDNEVEEKPADDTPRDFRGNPLPMRTNKKGEQVVDETALWNNDPEAWCHYNDANPEQIVTSVEKLEYAEKELAKQAAAAEKTMKKAALKGTTQDEIEDLRDDYRAKKDRLAVVQGILAEYKKPAKPAQTFAGEQRKAEASKKKEVAMAGFPGIQQRWGAAMKIDGAPDELTLANGEVVVGHYVLTDAMAMTPSHNPAMGFTMSDGFPVDENGRTVNDRDYERDKGAQAAVNEKAKDYDQRALQTPVIVSNDGVVLSGNDRTMSSQIAAQAGTDTKYVNYLSRYSQKYGFTAEQVAAIPHPRVVFVPDESMEYTASNFAKFNADDKKSQNKTEKAVKAGKTISPNALGKIAALISQFEDISEFYFNTEAVDALIGIMVEDGIITKEQVEAMKDGVRLSGTGMDLVEAMLVGSVLDEEALRVTMKDAMIRKSVVSAIAQIITNNAIADYTLRNELSDAIVIVFNGKSSKVIKYGDSVQGFVRQGNLFGDDVIAEATVQLLADAINNKKLSLLRRVLDAYNGEASLAASGQIDIFTGDTKSKEAILTDILNNLGYDIRTFDTIGRAAESAEESPAESAKGQAGEGGQTGSPVQSDAAGGEQVSGTEVTPESNSESSGEEGSVEGGEEFEPENEGNQPQAESSAARTEPSSPLTDAQKQVASELLGMSEAELEARSQELREQKRQEPLKARAKEWEARTGVKVNAISSIDEVTNKQARKAIESGETVFGWFEPKTGTVCLYLPHVPNESEIDKTYIHEVVSHKGLRELLGEEGFNSLMDSVWNDMMSDADKAGFLASVSHVKGSELDKQRAAADEFVASYAENLDLSKSNSKWDKFVEAVREILAKIGISLKVNEKDLSALLQASLARYEKMQAEKREDRQGNPLNEDGTLKLEKVNSIDELTNEDFTNPTRSVGLPVLPKNIDAAIGANGKPVIIKKNIFEKNKRSHSDLSPEQSRDILNSALYNPDLYGQTQKTNRPYNWVVINTVDEKGKNRIILLELNPNKDNIEVVHWHYIGNSGLERIKKQAEREGEHILVLPSSVEEEAGALPGRPSDLSSENKDSEKSTESNTPTSEETSQPTEAQKDVLGRIFGMSPEEVEKEHKARKSRKKDNEQGKKIEDFGEKIAGARKDRLRELSKNLEDATEESFVALALSKAFKRPNTKKLVEEGVLSPDDATFVDAISWLILGSPKPLKLKGSRYRAERRDQEILEWAKQQAQRAGIIHEYINADEAGKKAIIDNLSHIPSEEKSSVDARRNRWAELNKGWNDVKIGELYPLNPEYVAYRVFQSSGYDPDVHGRIKFPVIKCDSMGNYYTIAIEKNGSLFTALSEEDALSRASYFVQLQFGEENLDHPTSAFEVRGIRDTKVLTGRYRVYYIDRRGNLAINEFKSKDAAIKFAKAKHPEKTEEELLSGSTITEIEAWADPTKFKIVCMDAATGETYELDTIYNSREDAASAIDSNHEELNSQFNSALQKAREAKGEGTNKKDKLYVAWYSEYGRGSYGVFANDKNFGRGYVLFSGGFETSDAARAYMEEHRAEYEKSLEDMAEQRRSFVFFDGDASPRSGKDYRHGKDVGEEEYKVFGFRGVQFGNWTNNADRQAALNNAYDAFMDLADILGVSPAALSLNGELGLAFGARGSGSANAHYEANEVVINLSKTRGAGSLAHEWWHALDNYFARHGGIPNGFLTESYVPGVRYAVRLAFEKLTDAIRQSDYGKRSSKKGAYWGSPTEATARLFAEWVDRKMAANGESNHFLVRGVGDGKAREYEDFNYAYYATLAKIRIARDPNTKEKVLTFEEFRKTPDALAGFGYPTTKEINTTFGPLMQEIFDTIEEKSEDGKQVLFRKADDNGDVTLYRREAASRIEGVNEQFNEKLETLNEDNADGMVFNLGMPSDILRSAGISDMPMKLYGNKILKKMRKHGFGLSELKNLPKAVASPIAVFNNYGASDNRSILTELRTADGNFLVTLTLGKGIDIDFNIVTSLFGKGDNKIINWFNSGYAAYIDKEKALNYLYLSAPIAEAASNSELSLATKIVEDFENPTLPEDDDVALYRKGAASSIEGLNRRFNEKLQEQIKGTLESGYVYQLGNPSAILLSAGFPNDPIELSASHLLNKAKTAHHPFDILDIEDLPKALQTPIAVFSYGDKSKSQNVIVGIQHGGKNFVVGIHFNQGKRGAIVSDIRGLYPKDNAEWLNWISQGKALYIDKNKIQTLISQQRRTLAEVDYLDLNSITKIVEDFENPTLPEDEDNTRFRKEQIHTKQFKDWFGDWENDPENASKVVDESGEPLVVYHGSRSTEDFGVFDGTKSPHSRGTGREEAYFFSNADTAAVFASDVPQYEGEGRVVPAYLSIKNPARIDYEGAIFSGTGYEAEYYDVLFDEWTPVSNNGNKYFPSENLAVTAIRHIIPHGELIEGENIRITERKGVKPAIAEWIDGIDRDKYDGAVVENIGEMPTFVTTDYVAFRPGQIKSATENNGDFSEDNPDIRFRRHGMTVPVQGEDESGIDFTQRCIDRISYTYNMVADGVSVTEVESNRYGEYDPSTGKVTIFAKHGDDFFENEDTYFHENLHAFIDKEYDGAGKEIKEFYENTRLKNPGNFNKCLQVLRDMGYKEDELPEELFVFAVAERLANGELASDLHAFPSGARKIIEEYTNRIGYDIKEEEQLRSTAVPVDSREYHMRDSVREETPERRGGEESEGGSRSKAVGARGYTGDGVDWHSSSLYQREVLRETARVIGTPMEIVHGTYESPAPGMFDTSGRPIISRWNKGRVQICPNLCHDANDAVCTYIHEAVGHSGLSSVFDQNHRRKLYLGIYNALPDAIRREVADKAVTRYGGSVVSAIEEFLSNDAIQEAKGNPISIIEDSANPEEYRKSVWNVVRNGLTSAFGDKGLEVSLSLNDAKWLMAQSAFPNHESNPLEEVTRQVVANHLGFTRTQQAYKADGTDALRFRRKVDFQSDSAAEIYDRAVSDAWGRLKESYVDMYQSVEEGVKAIEQTTGRPAQAFENVLLALNQQSSKALATMQRWQSTKFAPMMTAIVNLANAISGKVEDVERYVMLKHGLERNEIFAKRDALDFYQRAHDEAVKTLEKSNLEDSEKAARIAAEDAKLDMHRQGIENGTDEKYLKLRKKDYSGLTGMYMEQGGNIQRNPSETDLEFTVRLMKARYPKFVDANGDIDLAAIENEANAEVEAIEREHSDLANTLWGAINAATKATLQEQYEANLLSREQYVRIRDMFKYYVPLRGFDDKTSEDFYSYYAGSSHSGYVNPIMHAEGRKSKAESPFGYIAAAESTAVAQGSKNMTKLALYYFVSNRANNDLLSVSDVWYKQVGLDQDDKPIYEAVYPNIPANATRAEVEQAVSDFEDDMKRMAKAGLAFKGENKLSLYGGTLRPSSSKMEHEHVIPFKLAGRDMMLIVHGNPRMAQAFTGALNYNAEEDILTRVCQEVLRFMASLNTQMNPEFWISNFQRDLLFSMMAVNVKEDKDYQRRYKNNLKRSIKNVIKYKKAYEKGALGNSYEENLYRQFVENGGVTGYTVMHDNAYWERRLKEFAGEERNVVSKVVNAFKGISDFGESFEQMTRFAAFCTSVETGKDIREAIADAKNLTVNFNRKGSGKLISYEEAKKLRLNGKNVSKTGAFMIHLMSAMSPLGRRCVMFFNAAIQGLSTTWSLAKTNPAKMAGWSTLFVLIGAANAALHAMLDDDDDYLDIPDFERRNNAMLGYNGAYLKWALPQEMRVFYGLGDMMVDHMLGRSPDKSLPVELLSAMGEVLPINPVEGILELDLPKIGKAMMPSAFTPILEIMVNEDYKGARVHNDYRYYSKEVARNIPKYRNPLPNTSKVFIGISEAANFLSGGDDVQAGWLNFDPNNIEHLFQGYTGGFGTAIGKGVHFVENTIQGEFAVRDTPFLRRLLVLNDERYRNSHTTDLYYYYKGEVENTKRILRDLKSDPDKIDRYMDFMKSEEYEVMQIFDINEKLLEYYDEEIRSEEDEDKRRALMQEQDALRKEMILEISEIGKKD